MTEIKRAEIPLNKIRDYYGKVVLVEEHEKEMPIITRLIKLVPSSSWICGMDLNSNSFVSFLPNKEFKFYESS